MNFGRLGRAAFIAGLALIVLGLGIGLFLAFHGSASDTDPSIDMTTPCIGGSTRPLTPQRLITTFRSNGISAVSSTRGENCGGEGIAYAISNTDRQDEEGWLSCELYRKPFRDDSALNLKARPSSPIFNGRKATLYSANLRCFFYPDSDEQMARFERAARQIIRTG